MKQSKQDLHKRLTREAFEALFNQRDFDALEKYWSSDYIQHSAHIPPGRDGLRSVVEGMPTEAKYEPGIMMAEGDHVIVHGRFSGIPGPAWIVVDIIRFEGGKFAEHWDIIQDEATKESSKSGAPMFNNNFGLSIVL